MKIDVAYTADDVIDEIKGFRPFTYGKVGPGYALSGQPRMHALQVQDYCVFCEDVTWQYQVFSYKLMIAWHCSQCGTMLCNDPLFKTPQGRKGKLRKGVATRTHVDLVYQALLARITPPEWLSTDAYTAELPGNLSQYWRDHHCGGLKNGKTQ